MEKKNCHPWRKQALREYRACVRHGAGEFTIHFGPDYQGIH